MQKNYYIYRIPNCNILINRLPIWFEQVELNGDENKGTVRFESVNDYDEIWGSNAKMAFDWIKKDRIKFFHAKEVQRSINIYNAINVVATEKKRDWLNSHEFTIWVGRRTKIIRKKYYPENCIHGIFYCELTERQFNIHAIVIREHYKGFKPFILAAYNSIVCH